MSTVIIDIYYKGKNYRMPWLEEFTPQRVKDIDESLEPIKEFYEENVTDSGEITIEWFDDREEGNKYEIKSDDFESTNLTKMWRERDAT